MMKKSPKLAAFALVAIQLSLWSVPAAAKGVPVEAATPSQMQDAVKQYKLGVDLLGAGKFDEALQLFQSSYDKVASPNSRLMIARTLAKLSRYADAYRELEATIRDAKELALAVPKYEKTVESAQAELADVSTKVALLNLSVDGRVTLNGTPLAPSGWEKTQVLPPGEVKLVYELKSGQRVEKTLKLEAGKAVSVELLAPAAEASKPATDAATAASASANTVSYTRLGWVSAGVGAGGFLAFGVFALLNDAESGGTYQTLSHVGLGVGLVGGLSAAYFFLFQKGEPAADSSMLTQRAAHSGTDVILGPRSISVRGQF